MSPRAKGMSAFSALTVIAVGLTGYGLVRSDEADLVPATHVVEIRQLEFRPAELTVAAGDTVVWINRDIVPHTASALDAGWDSGELPENESWRWVAPDGGRYPYFCEYHPMMKGSISVR